MSIGRQTCARHTAPFARYTRTLTLRTVAKLFLCTCAASAASAALIEQAVDDLASPVSRETSTGATFAVVTAPHPIRAGTASFRHEIVSGERSEIAASRTRIADQGGDGIYWLGWSTYLPDDFPLSDGTGPEGGFTLIAQWATYPTVAGRKFHCRGNGSHILLNSGEGRGHAGKATFFLQADDGNAGVACNPYEIADVSAMRGRWTDFVMHAKWTGRIDGFLRLWVRVGGGAGTWEQKIAYTGRTFWDDETHGPYFKMGTYVGDPGRGSRLAYTDEYRLGNSSSSFEEVNPGQDGGPNSSALPAVSFTAHPQGQASLAGGSITFSAAATGSPAPSYQWQRNGADIPGATSASHTVTDVQPAKAGVYTVTATGDSIVESAPGALGVALAPEIKAAGTGREAASNLSHPNGNIYDQFLLQGTGLTVRADSESNEALRISYIDLNDDIVQVEFSGAGTLTLVLEAESGPAESVNYNQPGVAYMKGQASIIVSGANETTHLTVFTVGRLMAHDPTGAFDFREDIGPTNDPANNGSPLFSGHGSTIYDGMADIGFIAILSENGKFGGLRTANVSFFGTRGITGIHAPNVQFTGPVYIGDLSAFDECSPMLIIGSAPQISVHGGDLFQSNDRTVQVSGITQLRFLDGTDSHNRLQPARANRARLEQNGSDVTSQIAVVPIQ